MHSTPLSGMDPLQKTLHYLQTVAWMQPAYHSGNNNFIVSKAIDDVLSYGSGVKDGVIYISGLSLG